MTYALKHPRAPAPIDPDKRDFAIQRGYKVLLRPSGFYIVGPRDHLSKNAAKKGQNASYPNAARAWMIAAERAQRRIK